MILNFRVIFFNLIAELYLNGFVKGFLKHGFNVGESNVYKTIMAVTIKKVITMY